MTDFYVGQIFLNEVPEGAAAFCDEHNYYIDDLEPENNVRRFQICEIAQPTPEDRKENFLKDFFKVSLGDLGTGYYRKNPKGYTSAIESITVAERMCAKNNGLPAGTLIFYQQPNFNKPEQCTEEWLEAHQIIMPALTVEQFDTLFMSFVMAWNKEEHE